MKTKEEKEFEKRVNLYYDDYNKYLIEIIKEVIPRQLVSLYNHNLILKHEKLIQHINSITDAFNLRFNFNEIKEDVEEQYEAVIEQEDTPWWLAILIIAVVVLAGIYVGRKEISGGEK